MAGSADDEAVSKLAVRGANFGGARLIALEASPLRMRDRNCSAVSYE